MKLDELLKTATPLPYRRRGGELVSGDESVCLLKKGATGDYLAHAANALPEVVRALDDCVNSLKRLEDKDGAYRVTCISEGEKALTLATTIKEK